MAYAHSHSPYSTGRIAVSFAEQFTQINFTKNLHSIDVDHFSDRLNNTGRVHYNVHNLAKLTELLLLRNVPGLVLEKNAQNYSGRSLTYFHVVFSVW